MRAWRWHGSGHWSLDDLPAPQPRRSAVTVRIGAAMVLSYAGEVLRGERGNYAMPPAPFIPGSNAIGQVEAVGEGVLHLAPGQRVVLSPHLTADERVPAPAQLLMGLTAMGGDAPHRAIQRDWPDGVWTELAEVPAAVATPIPGLDHLPAERLAAIGKFVVPFGGLLRGGLQAGETLVVTGATGFFGSAAVLLGVAMGAARVVAAGRNAAALASLAAAGGPRVATVALTGDVAADVAALREAAGGAPDMALDLLGEAKGTEATQAALRSLRRGGRLVLMGSAEAPLPIGFREMLGNDWSVMGCFMYPKDAPARLAGLIRAGLLDLSPVRVQAFPMAELDAAIAAAAAMRGLDLTVLLPNG